MYENWRATRKCPTLLQQVKADLREATSVSKEVLDRLAGSDEEDPLDEILDGYRNHVIFIQQKDSARVITDKVFELMRPMLETWLGDSQMHDRVVVQSNPPPPLSGIRGKGTVSP